MRNRQWIGRFQLPAKRALFVATAFWLCLALIGHDALMAGGAHAASLSAPESGSEHSPHDAVRTGHAHDPSRHHNGGDSDSPSAPCSVAPDVVSRADPEVHPTAHSAARHTIPQPAADPVTVAHEPLDPLPADVRRALLQVFLN